MSGNKKLAGTIQYTVHNSVNIIRGGAAYFEAIKTIAATAQHCLHFQTYIFEEDETGHSIADALMGAAMRKVNVYLMLDGYASRDLSEKFIDRMKQAGVHFRYFEPFLRSDNYYFGRRMHHKVLVADARVCLVGGLNIGDRYNDIDNTKAWLDWALLTEGEIAKVLEKVCVGLWQRGLFAEKCCSSPAVPYEHLPTCLMKVNRNDWVYKRTDISKSYREMFATAQKHATVMTSYFWPPQRMLRKMEAATKRGVKVRVVLAGLADVPLSKYAERYLYRRLFRSNIEVYEYLPSVLHGKIAFRDDEWATVGSYNMNNISAFASIELNIEVKNVAVAQELRLLVDKIITDDCRQITKHDFEMATNVLHKFMYYLSYMTIHVLFFLFTFYFNQVNESKK